MDRSLVSLGLVLLLVPLAGCFGGDGFDFVPGTGYKETGKTVHLRMWVEDMVHSDIYPGLKANLWAFCAEPADPNDAYSAAAIEYREPQGIVQRLDPEPDADGNPTFTYDDYATKHCSVPGPQLRVHQGDKVIVDFINDHFHPHTIHWHGQFVPWESDGVPGSTQDSVQPTTSFRYEFMAKRAGTLWYHCHVDTQFHVMQGLYGIMIVEPQDSTYEPDVDREYSLVLGNLIRSDVEDIGGDPHQFHKHGLVCGVTGAPACQNPAVTKEPDVFLINGVSAPNTFHRNDTLIKIDPGEKVRLRFLNAGPFTVETIHLHGHDMLVTHQDGNPVPAPYYVDTLLIGPGQRFDVVVEGEAGREGIWVMHTHITSRVTNDGRYPGGMLTKMVYEDWLEDQGGDITPFDGAELPGGLPYIKPYSIPDDFRDAQGFEAGLQAPDSDLAAWVFPVSMPCAVKQLDVRARFQVPVSALGALNDVTVLVKDQGGATVASGAPTDGLFAVRVEDLSAAAEGYHVRNMPMDPGNWTVSITGSSTQMTIDLDVLVDYYRTKEAMQYQADKVVLRDTCEEVMNPGLEFFYGPVFPPQE